MSPSEVYELTDRTVSATALKKHAKVGRRAAHCLSHLFILRLPPSIKYSGCSHNAVDDMHTHSHIDIIDMLLAVSLDQIKLGLGW
jgi:hypothetical protein